MSDPKVDAILDKIAGMVTNANLLRKDLIEVNETMREWWSDGDFTETDAYVNLTAEVLDVLADTLSQYLLVLRDYDV
jgi:hypothetical protein